MTDQTIPKYTDEQVQAAKLTPIEDVWQSLGLPSVIAGRAFCSPFRDDRTPSAQLGTKKNIYIDHGNDECLDTIALVQKVRHCEFPAAVKFIIREEPKGESKRAFKVKDTEKHWPTKEVAQAEFPKLPRAKNHGAVVELMLRDYGLEREMIPVDWRVIVYKGHLGIVYPGIGPTRKICCLRYKPVERNADGKRHPAFFLYYAGGGVVTNLWTLNGATPVVVTGGEEKAVAVIQAGFGIVSTMTGEGSLGIEWVRMLAEKGSPVILAHDKDRPDETGKSKGDWANDRIGAMLLEAGLAKEKILVVRWPSDLKDGGDLNDVLKDEGMAGLKMLLAGAVQWEPPEAKQEVKSKEGESGPDNSTEIGEDHEIFDRKGNIIPLYVARRIRANHPQLVYAEGAFWEYTGRIYEALEEKRIDRETIKLIEGKARSANLFDVRKLLATELPGDEKFFAPIPDKIAVENGIINLREGVLEPHTPENHLRNLLPVEYNSEADCPLFKRVFTEWLPDQGSRLFLLEFMGYCLVPDTSYEQSVFLVGKGANGKSTFVRLLSSLLGEANYSAVPLEALESTRTFPTAALKGKLLNVSPETGGGSARQQLGGLDEAWLKSLFSGEAVEVERKGLDPFVMIPTVRFLIQGNNPPHIADKSEGFWRKMAVVTFPNSFNGAQRDARLLEKLVAEKSGIFNLALRGLARLRARGRFEPSKVMDETQAAYRLECNPLRNWIDERFDQDTPDLTGERSKTSGAEAYLDYKNWCRDNGHSPYARMKFTREMGNEGIPSQIYQGDFGTSTRGYVGWSLRR